MFSHLSLQTSLGPSGLQYDLMLSYMFSLVWNLALMYDIRYLEWPLSCLHWLQWHDRIWNFQQSALQRLFRFQTQCQYYQLLLHSPRWSASLCNESDSLSYQHLNTNDICMWSLQWMTWQIYYTNLAKTTQALVIIVTLTYNYILFSFLKITNII